MVEPTYTRYVLQPATPPADDEIIDETRLAVRDALRELGVAGWQEGEAGEVVFWLPDGAGEEPGVREALARLGALGALSASAEAPGWRDAWRAFHKPVAVGELWVRPPWHAPRNGSLDVVIEVGMAFGTGAHATTRQCLEALCALPRASLLDLGTGSGVLALAALRLGYGPVYALDVDELAIAAAKKNARLNGLAPLFVTADLRDPKAELPLATVVVANLDRPAILALGERYAAQGGRGGPSRRPRHLLLAGLLESQADEVRKAFPDYGLRERLLLEEWALLHLELPA